LTFYFTFVVIKEDKHAFAKLMTSSLFFHHQFSVFTQVSEPIV